MYPQEYINFLIHFHGDRDYFECHEILEEYWKHTDPGNKKSIWVGLILAAVSTYHHRRGNFKGAKRTLEKALKLFESHTAEIQALGIDGPELFRLLNTRMHAIDTGKTYTSFSFPISDPALMELCLKASQKNDLQWGKESDMSNNSLIHRHTLRDRTSVIEERNRVLLAKKGSD